jgi:hypothetical protein
VSGIFLPECINAPLVLFDLFLQKCGLSVVILVLALPLHCHSIRIALSEQVLVTDALKVRFIQLGVGHILEKALNTVDVDLSYDSV